MPNSTDPNAFDRFKGSVDKTKTDTEVRDSQIGLSVFVAAREPRQQWPIVSHCHVAVCWDLSPTDWQCMLIFEDGKFRLEKQFANIIRCTASVF